MTHDEKWFKRLEDCGVLRNELSSLGWALWPKNQQGEQMGFFDEGSLRRLADELERRNKPFWDAYDRDTRPLPLFDEMEDEIDLDFPDFVEVT